MSSNRADSGNQNVLERFAAEADQVDHPVALGNEMYISKDMGDAFLVKTDQGDVVINTGFPGQAHRHQARFAEVSDHPLKYIILTQCHLNQIGGAADLKGAETQVIAQRRFGECRQYWRDLHEFYKLRSQKLWGAAVLGKRGSDEHPLREVEPDITFVDDYAFTLGGRRFEIYSTPGGESLDASIVWLPAERVLFTGNLFGPVFGHLPNLYTIRGDKIRSAKKFVQALELVLDLGPEMIVTGHEVIEGQGEITAAVSRLRDAVNYLYEQTIAGMNSGQTVHQLMATVSLPEELKVGQAHGKVAWCVRAIREEHAGWFHYDSTTSLYEIPRESVSGDLVELAGGVAPLVERADRYLSQGKPLEALHLLDIARTAEPDNRAALEGTLTAHQELLARRGGENFSEKRWLESELAQLKARLEQ